MTSQLLKIQEAFCCCSLLFKIHKTVDPVLSDGILTRDDVGLLGRQSFKHPDIAHLMPLATARPRQDSEY